MNKARRKEIDSAIKEIVAIREKFAELSELVENAKGTIENIKEAEEEAMENIPESLQGGTLYCSCEEAIQNLEEAYDALYELIPSEDDVDEIINSLESARDN